ncbi:hypothetical protein ACQEU3_28890 [Spirillospora sp. CA-253888]
MLISAAVCPHPPLLVPEVAGAAAPELDGLRAACDEAVRRLDPPVVDLSGGSPQARGDRDLRVVIVGGAEETRRWPAESVADLRPYGLDFGVDSWGEGPALPLSLTIGLWLLHRQCPGNQVLGGEIEYRSVAFDAAPEECADLGRELAASGDRVALLVMGDGSARRSEKAPGYLDDRAGPHDAGVARALKDADAAALAALDPRVSHGLQAAGRAAWQVLAGAAAGGRFRAELLADEAPYGVGYLVASWTRTG